jgi:DNA-binding CsgD family transcriptional regulator
MFLSQEKINWLSDVIRSLYAAQSPAELSATSTQAVFNPFRLAFASCEELSHTGGLYGLHGMETHVPLPTETPAYLHDHPMIHRVHDMPDLVRVRGIISRGAFERTDYFNGVARPMGFNDHVIVRVQRSPSTVTFSLCRDRHFSRDECDLLRLLQPHLEVAWKRVISDFSRAPHQRPHRLMLDPHLRPTDMSAEHISLFQAYFPDWRNHLFLPGEVSEWARKIREELDQAPVMELPRVLLAEAPRGILLLRYFNLVVRDGAELHLIERPRLPVMFKVGEGLSPREREVLHWIRQGKRDGEIGAILGLSAKTVGKHVEHLLSKLHVHNRTAAASRLFVT